MRRQMPRQMSSAARAMRGGGGNFGVVTEFRVPAARRGPDGTAIPRPSGISTMVRRRFVQYRTRLATYPTTSRSFWRPCARRRRLCQSNITPTVSIG